MNIRFELKQADGEPQSFVVGRKVRNYFKKAIEFHNHWLKGCHCEGRISDKSDGGAEWELIEAIGVNPGRYVGRIRFNYEIDCENVENDLYHVLITAEKIA